VPAASAIQSWNPGAGGAGLQGVAFHYLGTGSSSSSVIGSVKSQGKYGTSVDDMLEKLESVSQVSSAVASSDRKRTWRGRHTEDDKDRAPMWDAVVENVFPRNVGGPPHLNGEVCMQCGRFDCGHFPAFDPANWPPGSVPSGPSVNSQASVGTAPSANAQVAVPKSFSPAGALSGFPGNVVQPLLPNIAHPTHPPPTSVAPSEAD
jgi:hypothetical protein